MKKLGLLFIFLLFSLNAQVLTSTTVKTSSGSGVGVTREEAVNNAIIEAIGKIQGVKVKNSKIISTALINNELKDSYSSQISHYTNGKADSFHIDSITQVDGRYEADVTIRKISSSKSYKTPGLDPNNRRKMAIMPVFSDKDEFRVLNSKIDRDEVTKPLNQDILKSITNSRKFTVLDRITNKKIYALEEKLISSPQAAKDEALKLGNVLGADYLLLTNIADFNIVEGKSDLTTSSKKLQARVEFRVLMMATREVKFADVVNISLNTNNHSLESLIANFSSKVADEINFKIINSIYPIIISDVTNGNVIISQNLNIDEIYEVFHLGDKIVDPYTKEAVGRSETYTGKIQIVRQSPKISYAKVIDGSVKKGDVCRKLKENNQNQGRDTDSKILENGGVILPF